MSKILVIEPDNMLRQAYVMALFPDFEVAFGESLPQMMPSGIDAVVVHADDQHPNLAKWSVPFVWIEGKAPFEPPRSDRCMRITAPVTREELRHVLAQCLSRGTVLETHSEPQVGEKKSALKERRKNRDATIEAPQASGKFIELTDVVEEETA